VVASNALSGHPPSAATDGNAATDWQSISVPAWIYVDMGAIRLIDTAVLRWTAGLHAREFGIYVWTSYGWRVVYHTRAGAGGDQTIRFGTVAARYVAVAAATGQSTRIGIREVEVYRAGGGTYPYDAGESLEAAPDASAILPAPDAR
jgi:hypothetical protein